jgi:sensor c-di-GMP phosphodiesterase-like protein
MLVFLKILQILITTDLAVIGIWISITSTSKSKIYRFLAIICYGLLASLLMTQFYLLINSEHESAKKIAQQINKHGPANSARAGYLHVKQITATIGYQI